MSTTQTISQHCDLIWWKNQQAAARNILWADKNTPHVSFWCEWNLICCILLLTLMPLSRILPPNHMDPVRSLSFYHFWEHQLKSASLSRNRQFTWVEINEKCFNCLTRSVYGNNSLILKQNNFFDNQMFCIVLKWIKIVMRMSHLCMGFTNG